LLTRRSPAKPTFVYSPRLTPDQATHPNAVRATLDQTVVFPTAEALATFVRASSNSVDQERLNEMIGDLHGAVVKERQVALILDRSPEWVHVSITVDGVSATGYVLPNVLHVDAQSAPPSPTPSPTASPRGPTEVTKFVAWAVEHRKKAFKATSEPKCKPDGWCTGFCDGFASNTAFCSVRYWKADPQAVSFDLGMVPGPLACADLGDGAQERARTAQDVGCTLPSGTLALINLRGGKMNSVFVVTPEYRTRDTDMVLP
jgi:hypothetical protein